MGRNLLILSQLPELALNERIGDFNLFCPFRKLLLEIGLCWDHHFNPMIASRI
jgi:hypothetical protein